MRTYVGDRSGREPRVLVVERTLYPDPAEIVEFLANLSHLHDDDTVLSPEEQRARRARIMADKEVLLAPHPSRRRPSRHAAPPASSCIRRWDGLGLSQVGGIRARPLLLAHETGEVQPSALTECFAHEVVAHLPWIGFRLPATEVGYWLAATAEQPVYPAGATAVAEPEGHSDPSPALAVADPGLEVPGGAPADPGSFRFGGRPPWSDSPRPPA